MRVESEANLLGVVFTETGVMTAAPYRVVEAEHWVFAGQACSDGDCSASEPAPRLPGGASGHETDKISPSSPANVALLAKGTNDDGRRRLIILRNAQRRRGLFGRLDHLAQLRTGRRAYRRSRRTCCGGSSR